MLSANNRIFFLITLSQMIQIRRQITVFGGNVCHTPPKKNNKSPKKNGFELLNPGFNVFFFGVGVMFFSLLNLGFIQPWKVYIIYLVLQDYSFYKDFLNFKTYFLKHSYAKLFFVFLEYSPCWIFFLTLKTKKTMSLLYMYRAPMS